MEGQSLRVEYTMKVSDILHNNHRSLPNGWTLYVEMTDNDQYHKAKEIYKGYEHFDDFEGEVDSVLNALEAIINVFGLPSAGDGFMTDDVMNYFVRSRRFIPTDKAIFICFMADDGAFEITMEFGEENEHHTDEEFEEDFEDDDDESNTLPRAPIDPRLN
ncbi:hypothetical protein [Spirosoma agri]|uniref:Uncharacterized protein n=1 Tax=Spirosoma agri TaxID=1987381 RepID=A0A6M0IIC0_9BACT|nr:hypothetical protein [Spirosoma agri]NEU67934.1 hypothetical protein [Spirosoma agri]